MEAEAGGRAGNPGDAIGISRVGGCGCGCGCAGANVGGYVVVVGGSGGGGGRRTEDDKVENEDK